MKPSSRKELNERNNSNLQPKEINKSENTKNTEETQEILRLSIELGNNQLDYIHVFRNSQPEKLAYYFCIRNKLDYECLQLLIDQIKAAISIHTSSSEMKALSLSDLFDAPEMLPKHINDTNSNENQKGQIKEEELKKSLSGKDCITQQNKEKKDSNSNVNNNQLLTSFDTKPMMVATETYIPTNSRLMSSSSNQAKRKLNQSTTTTKGKMITPLQTQEKRLSEDLKTSTSHSKMLNSNSKTRVFSPISTSTTPMTSNRLPLNYGERLYHKGLKIQERTQEKLMTIKKEISQMNLATFKPNTNMISYNALSKRLMNKKNFNNDQMIIGYKDYLNNKIDKVAKKHKVKDNFSFSPKLNQRSILIEHLKEMENKSNNYPNESRYQSLYEDYKSHKSNIERLSNKIYNKDKMFKPLINQYECAYTSMPFNDRQGFFVSKSIEKQNETKKKLELNQNKDKQTGKAYFKPEINDCYQRLDNRSIFEDLYNDLNRQKLKKKALEEFYHDDMRSSRQLTHTNHQSNDIFENLKERIFNAVFDILDSDKDDTINPRNIAIKALPKKIALILEPIFYDIRKEDKTMKREEFVSNSLHLFDLLHYTEKKEVMNFIIKKKINNPNNFSFKPSINSSSSCLNMKRNSMNISFKWSNMIDNSNCNSKNDIISNSNSNSQKKLTTEILSNKNEEMKLVIEEEGTQEEKCDNENITTEQ